MHERPFINVLKVMYENLKDVYLEMECVSSTGMGHLHFKRFKLCENSVHPSISTLSPVSIVYIDGSKR